MEYLVTVTTAIKQVYLDGMNLEVIHFNYSGYTDTLDSFIRI